MKKVCFLFGSNSFEHEVSVTSLRSVLLGYQTTRFEIFIAGMDKKNSLQFFEQGDFLERFSSYGSFECADQPVPFDTLKGFDAVFPLVHGGFGEDGSIQGLLSLLRIPFVGPSVLSSAVCFDKEIAKRLLDQQGIRVVPWLCLHESDNVDKERVFKELGYPCFVKPSASGSSCGVTKVFFPDDLAQAVEIARKFSKKVLIEKAIQGMELECAVLGVEKLIASKVGRIIPKNAFYDYEAKYILPDGALIEAPAKIDINLEQEVQSLAKSVFKALDCEMMARVDFFYDGELYLNEVNTIPGFTPISLYPTLLGLSGIDYTTLLDSLFYMAIDRFQKAHPVQHLPKVQCPL
jgi:D-alanine-D-alanine ligase